MGKQLLSLLTQALLLLGTTAYTAREDGHMHHSKAPVPISSQEFYMFQRFANYTSASSSVCGAAPYGSTLIDYLNIDSTDTQAAIFRDDDHKEIIMAMPGTASARDAQLDFMSKKVLFQSPGFDPKDCHHCHVHKGFLKAWDSLAKPAGDALKKAQSEYPDYKIALSGHSLGAAIASLATAGLPAQGIKISRTVTFGEPRVGGPHFANYIDYLMDAKNDDHPGRYYRLTHANDHVPQVPKRDHGYQHSRTEYWERGITNVESYQDTFRCFGQEPSNCNDAAISIEGLASGDVHMNYAGIVMGALALVCG